MSYIFKYFFSFISIAIYVTACFMPAYVEAQTPLVYAETAYTEFSDMPGYMCLLCGLFFIPFAPFNAELHFIAISSANIFYLLALTAILRSKYKLATSHIIIAIIIGSLFLFIRPQYTLDSHCWVDSVQAGYYMWMLSFITLLMGLLVDYLHGWSQLITKILFLVAISSTMALAIRQSYDISDNSISFDDKNQMFTANHPIKKLILSNGIARCFLINDSTGRASVPWIDIYKIIEDTVLNNKKSYYSVNRVVDIYNYSQKRAPQQRVRIQILENGKAVALPIPTESLDNSFDFDIKRQCFTSPTYISRLDIIDTEHHNSFLNRDPSKIYLQEIPINEIAEYFNDDKVKFQPDHEYEICNSTHNKTDVQRILVHTNTDGHIDCVQKLSPEREGYPTAFYEVAMSP